MPRFSFLRRSAKTTGLDPHVRFNGASPLWHQTFEPNAPAVNDASVLGLPAAWRAVDLLTSTVSGLPIHAYRGDERTASVPSLLDRPNPHETRAETIQSIVWSLIFRGEAFLYLGGWDQAMRPTSFDVVHPDAVNVDTTSGEPLYRIGSMEPLTRYEVVHIRWLKVPGSVRGVGPVEAARTGLQGVLALDQYGRSAWHSNGVPSAVITVDDPSLSPEMAEEIKARWVANTSGATRTPTVLPATMSVKEIAWSPADAEYLDSRRHSLVDIANIFGVPVSRLGGDNPAGTYSNLTQDEAALYRYSIQPYVTRIEVALSDLLPRGTVARFNADALLRGTTAERYGAHKLGIEGGFLTPNEARALEGLPPHPDGDALHKPKASAPPAPEAPTDAPEEDAA